MKTLCRFLIPGVLFLCFTACTDDFATPDAKSDFTSVISDETKPSATAGDSQDSGIGSDEKDPTAGGGSSLPDGEKDGDGETAGDGSDQGLIEVKASVRDLRASLIQRTKADKGN